MVAANLLGPLVDRLRGCVDVMVGQLTAQHTAQGGTIHSQVKLLAPRIHLPLRKASWC